MVRRPLWLKLRAVVSCALLMATAVFGEGYTWGSATTAGDEGGETDSALPTTGYGTTRPLEEQLLVPVNVWGEVEKPGLYQVPDGTNVVELLSYAGGPTEFANLSHVKVTRGAGGKGQPVDVSAYLAYGDAGTLPRLQPGDTVYVHRNAKYSWRSFIEVVSQLAVIAGTVILYVSVANGE